MSFDWQTEDRDWPEAEPPRRGRPRPADLPPLNEALFDEPEPMAPTAPVRRRRWLFLIATVVLFGLLAAVLYWQLQRRTATAETRLTAEIAASHATVLDAARRGDGELFVSFLSGRDRTWAEAQEHLARAGGLVDRAPFGLALTPTAPVSPTVTLSPDLRAAELTLPQAYEVAVGNGLTETVTLEQTAVYRLGPDRWLFAPPDDTFWGETAGLGGRYVRLTYPARDADLAEPLARDLDAALAEFCRDVANSCANLHLILSTDPASLIDYDVPAGTWRGGSEIVMPTPTLFGRPLDDAGQRALTRVYAARVVSAAAANAAGWQCCDHALFYGALLDAQLGQLGLRPWPVDGAAHETLVARPELLRDVEKLWPGGEATPEQRLAVYALIDFIVARSDAPIVEMQRLLLDETTADYWTWLDRVTGGALGSPADFERALLGYAAEQQQATAPPLPLPDEVLQLVCRHPDATHSALYRYDPASGELTREQELAEFEEPMIVALPGRDGVAVFAREREMPQPITYIWRDGVATPIYPGATDGNPRLIPLPGGVGNDLLLLVQEGNVPVYDLLPLADCQEQGAGCTADPIVGPIVLSPDGNRSLLVGGEPSPFSEQVGLPILYVGDAEGQVHTSQALVEAGISPFWLSDDTFGYVATRQDGSGQERVMLRTAAGGDNAPLSLSVADELFAVTDLEPLTGGRVESDLTIDRVLTNPAADELLVFTAGPNVSGPNLALTYDLATAELRPRFALADEMFDYRRAYRRAYRFSPDGRWLAVSTLAQPAAPAADGAVDWWVYVHATDGSVTRRYALRGGDTWPAHWLSDWSNDGRWLALATDGYVRLVAPLEEYTQPIILPDLACSAAVWVQAKGR
jgi:hypothetical protein